MVIDSEEIKKFWEERGKCHEKNCGLTNLEEDPKLRKLKVRLEEEKINEYMGLNNPKAVILDLGGGSGYWALKFAKKANRVYVVDYCLSLIKQGVKNSKEKGIKNIEFIHAPAQEFKSKINFDIIFISGLLIYLNDKEIDKLIKNMQNYSKKGAILILRDGTGIKGRFEIINKFSENLKANYSAMYRTREEYIKIFKKVGFGIVKDENMFGEECQLNRFPETRLRIYKFEKE